MIAGQHLFTKDGRNVGNAIITEVLSGELLLFNIETDFGNVVKRISEGEIKSMWHLHRHSEIMISDISEWRSRKSELQVGRINDNS